MSDFIDGIVKGISQLWERGQAFLWGSAAACVLIFALLVAGWFLGIAIAIAALTSYGLILLVASIALTSLAVARSWESWPKKDLFFVPEEEQSIWGHSRQPSGEVYTAFNVRMRVTNVADTSFHISKARIDWPLRARWHDEVTSVLMTRHPGYPQENTYSHDFPIPAHTRSHANCVIALKGAICRPGKRLTFVVSVLDHKGKRHRIKFKRVWASHQTAA
jgi:hypothetical protein